jgi:tungstate transport system substrate-binding protein
MSGTHQKEMALWREAGIDPVDSDWYAATGLGTLKVLAKADKDGAYTIADRATWLAYRKDYPNLAILCQRDPLMLNYIRVIPGAPAKYPHVNYCLAMQFVRFVTSPEVQEMIRVSGVDKYGEPLYIPNAQCKP